MPAAIRPARPEDAALVSALVADAYSPYIARIGKPPGPMLDDYARRIAAAQVWVREEAGAILGVLVLEEGPDGLLLDNIAVAPAAQRGGHGRALMQFAEDEAARRGYTAITLYTHARMTENIAIYDRMGFAEIGRVTEKGYDRVYMRKTIATGRAAPTEA